MEDFCQKRLVILGSTGSIGTQALQVADQIHAQVVGLAACRQVGLVEEQIRRYRPAVAVMYEESAAQDLRGRVRDLPVRVLAGMEGLCELGGGQRMLTPCSTRW